MRITPILYSNDMHATLDFYIPLGFEARDLLQEGDKIHSMDLIYKENDDAKIIFRDGEPNTEGITILIEEMFDEVPEFQKERYGGPKSELLRDPNGYTLEFVQTRTIKA